MIPWSGQWRVWKNLKLFAEALSETLYLGKVKLWSCDGISRTSNLASNAFCYTSMLWTNFKKCFLASSVLIVIDVLFFNWSQSVGVTILLPLCVCLSVFLHMYGVELTGSTREYFSSVQLSKQAMPILKTRFYANGIHGAHCSLLFCHSIYVPWWKISQCSSFAQKFA